MVVDAFNEGYHIPAVHPEILKWKDDAALEYTPLHTHTRYGGGGWPMPSPRLGIPADEVDEQEILLAKVDDLIDNLPGYIGPSEAEALRAQVRELPDGMTAGDFYLNRRRNGAVARGLDWSHLSDEQVLGGDDLLVFPNFIGPVVAGRVLRIPGPPERDGPRFVHLRSVDARGAARGRRPASRCRSARCTRTGASTSGV